LVGITTIGTGGKGELLFVGLIAYDNIPPGPP